MEPLQVALSAELREFVESRAVLDEWTTSAEFVRHLIECSRRRWIQDISNMAQESIDSGPMTEWTKSDAEEIRRRVRYLMAGKV